MSTTYTIEDISHGATWQPDTTRCWFEIRTGGPLPGHVAVEHSYVLLTGLDETREAIVEFLNSRSGDDFKQTLTGGGGLCCRPSSLRVAAGVPSTNSSVGR